MTPHRPTTVPHTPTLLLAIASLPSLTTAQATFEFEDSGQLLGSSMTESIALADLNVAFGHSKVWMNDGDGAFTDSGQELSTSAAVALGDLDGDGDVDAFMGRIGSPHQVWLNSNNDGVFINSGQNLRPHDVSNLSRGAALGDVDGDGDLDAVTINNWYGNGAPNIVWLNDGTGTFTDSGQRLGLMETESIAMGDLDGDGDLDIFFGNARNTDLTPSVSHDTVWLNDGNGTFTDSGQTLGDRMSMAVELGDLDGDGDLDAWVGSAYSWVELNENTVWFNDGNGSFTDSGQELGLLDSHEVVLVDIDGDDDLDACVANADHTTSEQPPNTIWMNDGDGFYALSDQTLGVGKSYAIAAGPLDSDSDPDVFIGSYNGSSDNANRIWLNTVWGACCADIGCVQSDEATCLMFGGTYHGGHCEDTPCTDAEWLGACCVDSGCTLLSLEVCDELGGIWLENGDCGDCPSGMAEDIDNDGTVGPEDLARLLGAWGVSP
jgi:hypothetical protein